MRGLRLVPFMLAGCMGDISTPRGAHEAPVTPPVVTPRPRVSDCNEAQPLTTPRVFEGMRASCAGCHAGGAEFPLFASVANFETMVARNARFVVPQKPDESALFDMLEAKTGVLQMPPSVSYATLADADTTLPSLADLRCWVTALSPAAGPVEVSASLNRRLYAEYLQSNLEWALGLTPTSFSQGGGDYGLENPDGLSPRSPRSQYRMQQLGAPHWLKGTPRANELGITFVQITVQLSQAWCLKVSSANTVFYKYASASDGLSTPASAARVRQNLAHVFERVTGETAPAETLDALIELFRLYDTGLPRAGWPATCAAIVRHPLSLTF